MLAPLTPLRIVLVDDAPSVREALRWAFEDEADLALVGEAADGSHALTLVQETLPDIVILDIELPDVDGFQVAQRLKAIPNPPIIIFLSVHSEASARQRAIAAGGDGYVEKGRGWSPLLAQIRLLGQHF
jgi:DNA-binding NarL/FixJ family response regulator